MTRPDQPHTALTALSEDEAMLSEMVARFAKDKIEPHVMEMDKAAKMNPDVIKACFELGLMGVEVPVEYGGGGMSFTSAVLVIEELARVDPSVSVMVDVQNTLVINAFLRWGTDAQKKAFLPRLCSDTIGSFCLSEAVSGSDAFALKTKATREGDDYLLNGTKLWITNGNEAGIFLVFANVDFEAGYRGITAFLVERDMAGFTVGKKEDKLGIRASSTVELSFEDCRVPAANVLGEVGKGYKIAIGTLNEGRIGIGAQMVGLARGALDHAIAYVLEREQFGKPIGLFQGMQFQYAQAATDIEAARLMVHNAARLKDMGRPFVTEAAMAKLFSSQVAERVASLGVELHGGVGFSKEYPAEKYYRDAKIGSIYEGTSNMQLQTIAKTLAAKYA